MNSEVSINIVSYLNISVVLWWFYIIKINPWHCNSLKMNITPENSLQAFQTDSKLRLRPVIRRVSGTKLFIFRCVCTPAFFLSCRGCFSGSERDRVKVRDAGKRILQDASPAQRGSGLIQLAPLPPPLPLWLNINVTCCQQGLWLSWWWCWSTLGGYQFK